MKTVFSRFTLAIVMGCTLTMLANAQWRSSNMSYDYSAPSAPPIGENIFSPEVARVYVSAFIGANNNFSMGNFSFDCDCGWDGGFALDNIGALVGADITYAFSPSWAVMAKVMYDNKHFVDEFTRTLSTPIKLSNSVTVKPVEFEEEADVSLAYATVGLFMRWQPRLERWYVFAGPAAGFNISSSINHTQRIVTEELTFREILDTERTSKDASFPATDYRLEAMVGFGYDYIVRPRWYVNPEIRIGYPISTVSDDDEVTTIPPGYDSWDDWKVASFQISIGLKYEAF